MSKWQHRAALIIALMVFAMSSAPAAAKSRSLSLSAWTDRELIPTLATQLTEHPRFKGESVAFVALDNGVPAPISNALIIALRDRMVEQLVEVQGVSIGWQAHDSTVRSSGLSRCRRDEVHYYIGLEVMRLMDGRYRIKTRVLDAEEQKLVAGFGQAWEGRLTSTQRRAIKKTVVDEYFRGHRSAPFTAAQADMLAARVAQDLACALLRQSGGEYVIASETPPTAMPMAATTELVSNNLAAYPSLRVTTQKTLANAVLRGKAHRISGDLFQYWLVVTPTDSDNAMQTISASAYVRLPVVAEPPASDASSATAPTDSAPAWIPTQAPSNHTEVGYLTRIDIVEPRRRSTCDRAGSSKWRNQLVTGDHRIKPGECFFLQTRINSDADVYLLNYQVRHGLVRLSGDACSFGATSIAARAGEQLQFPPRNDSRQSISAWPGTAGIESFYVVAVNDPTASRELRGLIERLPVRCSEFAHQGLHGTDLDDWMTDFSAAVSRWQSRVDWQAVRISHEY